MPAYPNDLDDSSCCWSAIYSFKPSLLAGKSLAIITKILVQLETKPGGPYRTWLTRESNHPRWSDVDLAVNANVAYFLKLLKIELPSLTIFFDQAILSQNYSSPYYPTPYPIIYFIARAYSGSHQKSIISHLLSLNKKDSMWGNPLHTALAATALIRLGHRSKDLTDKVMTYLSKTQLKDGSWPADSFCYDPSINGKHYYAGAASLTTSLVLEYAELATLFLNKSSLKLNDTNNLMQQLAWDEVNQSLSKLDSFLQPLIKKYLRKLKLADEKHDISLWTFYFATSLNQNNKAQISYLTGLNTAHLWGWLAYTLYDDVLDDDADVATISLANIAHRQLVFCYQEMFNKFPSFLPLFTEIMNRIDLANFQETRNRAKVVNEVLTLPKTLLDYSDLTIVAEKSLGHALGPLAILYQLGYSKDDAEVTAWINFMRHYLTARQLNDDAHDWENDLKNGCLTPVVVNVIKKINNSNVDSITLDHQNIRLSQKIFWHEVFPKVTNDIKKQINLSLKSLDKITLIDTKVWEKMLQKIEQGVDDALLEQKKASDFVGSYGEKV